MGRECRRVPPDWEHPRDERGQYKPLHDKDFATAAAEWKEEFRQWEAGFQRVASNYEPRGPRHEDREFWEWDGGPPDRDYYRPSWPEGAATHFQMYETCSEGTPISPVFATPEEVARWCADNGASAFGEQTASYGAWLRVARGGYAPSGFYSQETGMISGVEAMQRLDAKKDD